MSNFSDAWKLARNSGLWKFLWNGHYYNTRKKGESDAEWNNFLTSNTDLLRRYNNYMNGTNLPKNSAEVVLNDRLYDYNNLVPKPYNPGTVSNPNSDLSNLYIGAHNNGTDEIGLPKFLAFPSSESNLSKIKISLPIQSNYNRRDIRQWISTHFNNDNNPYQLSGAERRAIRMVANNTANDNDRAIYALIKDKYTLKDNSQWFKNGGMINYFQQGGQVSLENPQEKIVALVLAASQGDKLAIQTILQIQQAAENGDEQATQIMQFIQQVMQQMQQQALKAKYGAKLGYIASLKGMCPNGSHLEYFKAGGQICKKCVKDAKQQAEKKVKLKMACGGATKTVNLIKTELCGGKVKKR